MDYNDFALNSITHATFRQRATSLRQAVDKV